MRRVPSLLDISAHDPHPSELDAGPGREIVARMVGRRLLYRDLVADTGESARAS